MEFDENKVFCVLNADKVKVGSKGFFSDDLASLKNMVKTDAQINLYVVKEIMGTGFPARFVADYGSWHLFYLVEEPKENTYRPYANTKELFEDFKERIKMYGVESPSYSMTPPAIWVKDKNDIPYLFIIYSAYQGAVGTATKTVDELFEEFTYLDGSPCGKKNVKTGGKE